MFLSKECLEEREDFCELRELFRESEALVFRYLGESIQTVVEYKNYTS